jgi:DNA-3-methyladenine glycosylase II
MSPDLAHTRLVVAATSLSQSLREALIGTGPLWFPEREDQGLAIYLARAIVGQQLSTNAARTIWARFEARAAAAEAPLLALLRVDNTSALRACGVSANKAKALIGIAEAAAAGRLDAALVRAMDHRARSEHLCGIWGIGQWTADMVSIFYCHDPDVWPAGDASVRRMFATFIGRRRPENAVRRFAPYRSILALHMWRLLDRTP